MTHNTENDAPSYRVLSPNPGSTDGWPIPRGFCEPCAGGDHVFHVRGACSLVQCGCVIPPGVDR